jgi:hypothetical protein
MNLNSAKPKRWALRHVGSLLAASATLAAPADPADSARPQAAAGTRRPTPTVAARHGDCFADVTRAAGVEFVHQLYHDRIANILLSNGAGGAVLDYDNDGRMDIFLVNASPLEGVTAAPPSSPRQPNRLFRNLGDGTFRDVTSQAGLAGEGFASAAAAGDFDNDGFTDLCVVCVGHSQLYRNRGDGTFADVTASAGIAHAGTGVGAVFADFDRDGWLDLFVANYLTFVPARDSEQNPGAYPGPLAYAGQPNVLYRNRGDGTFLDVTRAAGLFATGHRAMSAIAFDVDGDGDVDLYVANDDTPNSLWLNDGRAQFHDVGVETGVAFNSIGEAPGSMNATVADVDGDLRPDLFVTRFGYGSLYVQTAPGRFADRMWASGLGRLTRDFVGWGGVFLDFDNDGDPDLFIANGDAFKLEGSRSLLLENTGQGRFADAASRGGAFFEIPVNGRGSAVLDFDNDGRLDLLVTTLADRPFLLHNRCPGPNHWLKLQLEGTQSNRSGYGARIAIKAGAFTAQTEAICPAGFLLQSDPRPHFGLGARDHLDRIEIRWPSGRLQSIENPPVDRVLRVKEPRP